MDWYVQQQTELSLAALNGRRQASQQSGIKEYYTLLLHWFNAKTMSWVPIQESRLTGSSLVASIPASVLNNQEFSGKVANMLVSSTIAPDTPICGEFQQLVGGKEALSFSYLVLTAFFQLTVFLGFAGKCREKSCTHTAKLSKLSPADCLAVTDCNFVCAMSGWCIHPNNDGSKGMLKTLYRGTACKCPSGIIMKVRG
jgi:hypothetical protein